MNAFERTEEQRQAALRHANEIRTKRKELKWDLRAGRITPAEVLTSDAYWLQTMLVRDVLLATPKLGRTKVACALNCCSVSPSKTIGGITDGQRERLLTYLTKRFPNLELGKAA